MFALSIPIIKITKKFSFYKARPMTAVNYIKNASYTETIQNSVFILLILNELAVN